MRAPLAALVLLSAAATSIACSSSADSRDTSATADTTSLAPSSPGDALWGRTFVSTAVTGTAIPGGGPLEVAFPERDGIAMSAGCNRGVGSVDLADGVVTTGPIATTMTACPGELVGADKWMTDLFASRPGWTYVDDVLTLAAPGVTVVLADKKTTDPDRPVVGTAWVVESLIGPDAVVTSTALDAAAPTLTIGQDGRATGSTGCNRFDGPVRVGDSTITLGPLATTRTACPDDLAEIERTVLHVLDGEVTYSVEGPTMRLLRADGTGLGLRSA